MKSKILFIVLSVFVLVAAIGIGAMYKIGDQIIEKALEAEISDALSGINNDDRPVETVNREIIRSDSNEDTGRDTKTEDKPSASSQINKGTSDSAAAEKNTADKVVKNTEEDKENQYLPLDGEIETTKDRMAPEKIKEIKDKVSAADKMTAAALVLKRLKQSDINKLMKMLEGGLTVDEKDKAKRLVYERFTAEEVAKIKEIYRKYMYQ